MQNLCRIAASAAFVFPITVLSGCGWFAASEGEFVLSRRTRNLVPQARDAVEKALTENFIVETGRVLKAGRALYAKHCVQCHGSSGGGDGPMAKGLNPPPRDYRLGVFKFTSTAHQEKASRNDLQRTVKHGIPGTSMPSFALMEQEQIDALVEYVRWLAVRGEFEKKLVDELSVDYSVLAVEERKQMGETESAIDDELTWFLEDELAGMIDSAAESLAEAWTRAEQQDSVVQPRVDREENLRSLATDVTEWLREHGNSLEPGELVALSKRHPPKKTDESLPEEYVAVRVRLDGKIDGSIAGQELLWTSGPFKGHKYTIRAHDPLRREFFLEPQQDAPQLDIEDAPPQGSRFVVGGKILDRLAYVVRHDSDIDELVTLAEKAPKKLHRQLILGSAKRGRSLYLTPKAKCAECHGPDGRGDGELTRQFTKIPGTNDDYPTPGLYDSWHNKLKPQDLARGIYRGGEEPIDLYRRIYVGIKGTPMPAFGETVLNDDEIWDLVDYVLSVPFGDTNSPSTSK